MNVSVCRSRCVVRKVCKRRLCRRNGIEFHWLHFYFWPWYFQQQLRVQYQRLRGRTESKFDVFSDTDTNRAFISHPLPRCVQLQLQVQLNSAFNCNSNNTFWKRSSFFKSFRNNLFTPAKTLPIAAKTLLVAAKVKWPQNTFSSQQFPLHSQHF